MTLEDLKSYFGSYYRFCKETNRNYATVYCWKKRGYIPIRNQLKIQKHTNGELKADLSHTQE